MIATTPELDNSMKATKHNVDEIQKIIDDVVLEYSSDLDDVMRKIYVEIVKDECPAINTIEKYFMELSSCLYFMCEKSEKLGVFDSISKLQAQETYNMKYLEHQHSNDGVVGGKKPTVAESAAVSENASMYDKATNDLYNKAYKIIKAKISAAETMVGTLSKILSHRIQESNLVSMQTGRKILNEEAIF